MGAKNEMLSFTSNLDSVNHVVNGDHLNETTVQIPIVTLNEIFSSRYPQLMKIDVEGFEWNVLLGADKILNSSELKAIIIELNSSGMRYGFSDEKIHMLLTEKKFIPYQYEPFSRVLTELDTFGEFNTIYIKDLDWVRARIKTNPKFHLLGQEI